ncbi:MAG: hypothetical protein WC375_00990 [Methanomassiliicoccales archaeon]|jgi:hypothetical protein
MEEKPCCAAAAARKIKHVHISDSEVGLVSLDEIMNEVKELELNEGSDIGKALLKRVKIYNYVPSSTQQEYEIGLLNEYYRRFKHEH